VPQLPPQQQPSLLPAPDPRPEPIPGAVLQFPERHLAWARRSL